jgi:nucleotide-binding universal stress UspA family protein
MTQHPYPAADPSGTTARPMGPVVLGTEFGPVSAAAERVAIGLAVRAGVPLLIVHGIDPGRLRVPGGRYLQRVDQARSAREAEAMPMMERVRAAGVEPQLLIWDGDPATCIVEAARAEGASRIVVGSHGRGLLGRVLVGSVSTTVAGQADCPVDIVRGDPAGPEIVTIDPVVRRI